MISSIRQSVAQVDLTKLSENTKKLKQSTGGLLMAMVKADAYGHGMLPVARTAVKSGADWLGVAIPEEAIYLKENGIKEPVLITGALYGDAVETVRRQVRHTVCSAEDIYTLQKASQAAGICAYAHVKLDTGMNRIGLRTQAELEGVLSAVQQCSGVVLEGAFTHLAASDWNDEFTVRQLSGFESMLKYIRACGHTPITHASNSGASLLYPQRGFDMIRPGIALYGYRPSRSMDNPLGLEPVLTWKAPVVFLKTVPAGEGVSYDLTYTTDKDTVLATLPVGYGDGYMRSLSNKGCVLINGCRAPIVGRICMDQMMVDATGIPDVHKGTEAVLIGRSGKEQLWADELAELAGTISYEITISITNRVPKVYI